MIRCDICIVDGSGKTRAYPGDEVKFDCLDGTASYSGTIVCIDGLNGVVRLIDGTCLPMCIIRDFRVVKRHANNK